MREANPSAIERLLVPFSKRWPGVLERQALDSLVSNDPRVAAELLSRHARALADAIRLRDELNRRGIRSIFLKGPTLEFLYAPEATRPYSDLDVWVDRSRLGDAILAANAAGWQRPRHAAPYHFHVVCPPKTASLPLELHTCWVDRANLYRLPDDAGASRTVIGPDGLPRLCASDLLMYLCLHANKHGFLNETALALGESHEWFLRPDSGNRLLWWLDIALLLETPSEGLDWETCRSNLLEWNISAPVAVTLHLVARFFPKSRAREALALLRLESFRPRCGGWAVRCLLRRTSIASMRPNARNWRLARLAQVPDLLIPSSLELAGFLRKSHATMWDRLRHPFRMLARLAGRDTASD